MQKCMQFGSQSIYDHGISVKNHTFELIESLNNRTSKYKLPDWFFKYKEDLLSNLLDYQIIENYAIFHDIGKMHCKTIDEFGKPHFPNHAEKSYEIYFELTKDQITSNLIRLDMKIHTMKVVELNDFVNNYRELAPTLLIVGLAEIISNSKMFGGFDSINYKIKYKQIDKMGKNLTKLLFGEK